MTTSAARYTTQAGRAAHSARPNRESLSKRIGVLARRIKARDNHTCVYCGATAESTGTSIHLDHLTPKSQGGLDIAINLVVACRSCNCRRKDRSLAAWAAASPELSFTAASIRGIARRKLPVIA